MQLFHLLFLCNFERIVKKITVLSATLRTKQQNIFTKNHNFSIIFFHHVKFKFKQFRKTCMTIDDFSISHYIDGNSNTHIDFLNGHDYDPHCLPDT